MKRLLALTIAAVLAVALLPVLPASASSAAEFEQCVIEHFKKTGLKTPQLDNTPRAALRAHSAKVHAHLANGGSPESSPRMDDNFPTAVYWVHYTAQSESGMTLVEYSKEERCLDFRSQFRFSGSPLNQFDYYAVGAYVTKVSEGDPEIPEGLYSIVVTFLGLIAAPTPTTTPTTTPPPAPTTTTPRTTTTHPSKTSPTTAPAKPPTQPKPSTPAVTPPSSNKSVPPPTAVDEAAELKESANTIVGITPETEAVNRSVTLSRLVWSQLRSLQSRFAGLCRQERTSQFPGPFCALARAFSRLSHRFAPTPPPRLLRVM